MIKRLNRELLNLAIPNIISNISVPLLSTVDTVFMGHISVLHLGAIGLGTMIFNFLYWNFGFLRMGTTGLVAQAYGRADRKEIRQLLYKSIIISLLISLALVLFGKFLFSLSITALAISEEMRPLVGEYFNILIWGAPASLLTFVLMGWLFGMQNARIPMYITIIVNVINIGLSYYLVYVRGMGMQGVALGTLIALYLGLAILIFWIVLVYPFILERTNMRSGWLDFLNINRDLFIRTVALTFAFGFFYRQSSASGAIVLAANIIFLQLLNWMSYGIDGFAYAAESLVGKYHGARDPEGLKRAILLCFQWGLGLSIFFGLNFGIGHHLIVQLFTDDSEVLTLLSSYRFWIALIPLGAFACYIWDGIFIGLTASGAMRDTMLLSLLIYLTIFYALEGHLANAIWISLTIFLVVRGVLQHIWWHRKIRRTILVV